MIFIASSPRAISTPLTWCQQWSFVLEAILWAKRLCTVFRCCCLQCKIGSALRNSSESSRSREAWREALWFSNHPHKAMLLSVWCRLLSFIVWYSFACSCLWAAEPYTPPFVVVHCTFFSLFFQGLLSFPGHFYILVPTLSFVAITAALELQPWPSLMVHPG